MKTFFVLAILLAALPASALFAETTGPKKGALVIMGGGGQQAEVWRRFLALSGGENARIVFIPTANEDAGIAGDGTAEALQKLGARHVTMLHTRDPKEADTEKFVEPLRTATGVWIGGGRQWRLADAYLKTRVVTELDALLARGGAIGGTSAGATIQGDFLVRGDTKGNELMEGDHLVGFGFLRNAAIDQHILRRNRQFDLLPVIEKHPDLLGIGIDENTAIVVQDDQFEVIGASYVAITDAQQWQGKQSTSPNSAAAKGKFYLLSRGERFDLKTRRVLPPAKRETVP